jgi:hypothetical protein
VRVKDILTGPSKWTQGAAARDWLGRPCSPESKRAVSYCIMGVLMCVYKSHGWEYAVGRVMKAISTHGYMCKSLLDVADWNNHPGRTFREVRLVIERADV